MYLLQFSKEKPPLKSGILLKALTAAILKILWSHGFLRMTYFVSFFPNIAGAYSHTWESRWRLILKIFVLSKFWILFQLPSTVQRRQAFSYVLRKSLDHLSMDIFAYVSSYVMISNFPWVLAKMFVTSRWFWHLVYLAFLPINKHIKNSFWKTNTSNEQMWKGWKCGMLVILVNPISLTYIFFHICLLDPCCDDKHWKTKLFIKTISVCIYSYWCMCYIFVWSYWSPWWWWSASYSGTSCIHGQWGLPL